MRKVIILAVLVFLVAPSAASANQKVVAAMKQKCILQWQTMFIDGRPYFEKLKTSREAFEAEMRKSNVTESEVNALITFFDTGTEGIKAFCDCQSVEMYIRLPDRAKILAAKVVTGEGLTPEEQQEYLKSVNSLRPGSPKDFARCMK
jgi:hypothetical protein